MARQLTPKRKGFVKDYLLTGNATQAVKNNFDVSNDNSAAAMGSELLTMPKVREYIESKSERAAEIIFDIAENGQGDAVRLNASKDILDRAGFKPIDKTMSLNINADAQITAELKDLANGLLNSQRK